MGHKDYSRHIWTQHQFLTRCFPVHNISWTYIDKWVHPSSCFSLPFIQSNKGQNKFVATFKHDPNMYGYSVKQTKASQLKQNNAFPRLGISVSQGKNTFRFRYRLHYTLKDCSLFNLHWGSLIWPAQREGVTLECWWKKSAFSMISITSIDQVCLINLAPLWLSRCLVWCCSGWSCY